MTTTISTKGQIVLPAEIRQLEGILPGQEFEFARGEYPLVRQRVALERSVAAEVFCKANDLESHFQAATVLAKKHFSSLTSLHADLERDPESDDEWIALVTEVAGTVDDILASYNDYSSEWVRFVSAPQRFMIRLSFSII